MGRGIKQKRWHDKVIAKDGKCIICGSTEHLEAHHIYTFKDYPKKRYLVSNGVTLCKKHHTMYHTSYLAGYRTKSTDKTWFNFLELMNKLQDEIDEQVKENKKPIILLRD